MSLRVTVLKEFLKAPSGLTASDVQQLLDATERTEFNQVYNCIQDALRNNYLVRGETLPEGVCYEITPQGQEYMKKTGKKEGRPMNKSALAQKIKQPSKSVQTAKIVVESPLALKSVLPNDFEARIPAYDINDDSIVMSKILPDLRCKTIPVNVKTSAEIKAHINNTVIDAGEHYRLEYRGVKIDPFRIAQVYRINDFAMMTVLKKVLRAGRAHKDLRQDLLDMKCAIDRKLEMMAEDNDFE
jgi:hypothetical protein